MNVNCNIHRTNIVRYNVERVLQKKIQKTATVIIFKYLQVPSMHSYPPSQFLSSKHPINEKITIRVQEMSVWIVTCYTTSIKTHHVLRAILIGETSFMKAKYR